MNDYQFDFIAKALLAILAAITQVAEHRDPDRVSWRSYEELYDQHMDWRKEKGEEENG